MNKIAIPLILLLFLFVQCEKDEELKPEYIGKWQSESMRVPTDFGTVEMRQTLTLEQESWQVNIEAMHPLTSLWIGVTKIFGDLDVEGNKATLSVTRIESYNEDGNWVTVNKGDAEFDALLESTPFTDTMDSEFTVSGNQLTISMDLDNDGLFSETEMLILTRVE